MAYSKSPTLDTYSSQRVPVAWDLSLLAVTTTTDYPFASGLTNMVPYPKVDSPEELYAETRYGISCSQVASGSTMVSRGCYVWEKTNGTVYYYVIVYNTSNDENKVYTSTDATTWTAVNTWTQASTAPCRFTEYIDDTNTKKLILVTGTKGYIYTTDAAGTEITDADFPSPHVPFPVFLDGYLFLAKANTGDIYNSVLNQPQNWVAGDFISSELYPDDIRALVKMNNYILAIGAQGSEFFYDAANPTGSPLARVQGANLPFGTTFPNSVASGLNKCTFLANTSDGGISMVHVEGQNFELIPAEVLLHIYTNQLKNGVFTEAACRGFYLRMQSQLFYVFQFRGNNQETTPTYYTLMYCFRTKKWVRLKHQSNYRYPIFYTNQGSTVSPLTYVCGHTTSSGVFFGSTNAGYPNDVLPEGTYQIAQEMLIPPTSFGTLNRKTMSRLGVFLTSYDDINTLTLNYSDDGNVTFSSSISIAPLVDGFPFATQLGAFRNRGFKLGIAGNSAQVYYIECDINKGMR